MEEKPEESSSTNKNKETEEVNVTKSKSRVTEDIVTEDFYVKDEDNENNIGLERDEQLTDVEEEENENKDETERIDIDENGDVNKEEQSVIKAEDEPIEADKKTTKQIQGEDQVPESDFFEAVEDEDAEKKKVVDAIPGMTEIVKNVEDIEETQKELVDVGPSVTFHEQKETIERSTSLEENMQPSPTDVQISESGKSLEIRSFAKDSSNEIIDPRRSTVMFGMKDTKDMGLPRKQGEIDSMLQIPHHHVAQKRSSRLTKKFSQESGKKSTSYIELGPRIMQMSLTDEDLLGFSMGDDMSPFQLFDYSDEGEEEEIPIEEEEKVWSLIREPYYQRHDDVMAELAIHKMKNFVMQKKLAMFFKRRKMDYVTKETEWSFDAQNKYFRKLQAFGELIEYERVDKATVTIEIENSKKQRREKFIDLENLFKQMQEREKEVGYGLINTKTGNTIQDKHVERLIRRQEFQMEQVSSMRLKYIKLKDMVQEKLDAIAALDKIAPNLLLVDYEQLKIDNRSHADKIEEKDEELTRLRAKCANAIQVLAHIREKSSALENDVDDLQGLCISVERNFNKVRERVNNIKQQRDFYRNQTNKIRQESGLLTQPSLLQDMEKGLTNIKAENAYLEALVQDHKKRAKQIKIIRKKIEKLADVRRDIMKKSSMKIKITQDDEVSKIYKGRPTLLIPTLEESAFNSLKTLEPKLTNTRSHRTRMSHISHKKGLGY